MLAAIFGDSEQPAMTAADSNDDRFSRVCDDLKMSVKLCAVETALDIDDKEFTMYSIEVTSGTDSRTWILHRRFSQFFELKTRLERLAGYEDAVKGTKFPGKVFFNKTAPKVVEERKVALMDWLNALLMTAFTANYHVNSFLEAIDDDILAAGEFLPVTFWTDADNKPFSTADIPTDSVAVISAASYWTYQALTAFMDPCSDAVMKKYPSIRQLHCGISEMRLVPAALRSKVQPVLALLIKNAQKKLDERSEKHGVPKGANGLRFMLDFDGSALKPLRVRDCDWTWRVWIVYRGNILASLRSSTPDAAQEYVKAFDKVAAERKVDPSG